MMAALPAAVLPRLGQLVRLLGSDYDGEVVGAARAIGRTLSGVGASLHDLADVVEHPPAPLTVYVDRPATASPRRSRKTQARRDSGASTGGIEIGVARRREIIAALQIGIDDVGSPLTPWEVEFAESIVASLRGTRHRLSHRQMEIVERLIAKIEAGGR